jgi:hypothetical protein
MANAKIRELESVVAKLESERQAHLEAISEIEAAFQKMGITPTATARRKPGPKPGKRRGRKPGPKPGRKPGPKPMAAAAATKAKVASRGKGPTGNRYAVSGTDLVLNMVRKAGAKGISGGEVNKVWQRQGRAGSAYNILGALLKENQVKKQPNREGRGSLYIAA